MSKTIGVVASTLFSALLCAACPNPPPPREPTPPGTIDAGARPDTAISGARAEEPEQGQAQVQAQVVRSIADLKQLAPLDATTYRIHLIDVGTGLAVLVVSGYSIDRNHAALLS